MNAESEYIERCKRLIEEKFHFEKDSGTLRQRDLEYLADCIEEKSGIKLSLSTLKRLWKKDYDQTPHPSTLQALVSILGYKDWHDFKSGNALIPSAATTHEKKRSQSFNIWMALPALIVLLIIFWLIAFRSDKAGKPKPVVKGPITFTGDKTVSQGVPNTVIFNYDLSNVEADSFFFQQAWNDQEKVKIDPKEHYYSNIYYYPGFHKAKLIANDSILKRFRVHITTDNWLPLVRYSYTDSHPIYIKQERFTSNGALHIKRNDLISSNINVDKDFMLSYYNVRDFENTYSDNFSLETRVVVDSSNTIACPGFELVVTCEAHIFFVRMMGKGCEREIAVKMGEVIHNGVKNNLSTLGRNLYKWQRLQVRVVHKQATIFLDDQPVYTINFKDDFGKVVGLVYNFTGTGAVDYVKLKNGENKVVYEDDFEE